MITLINNRTLGAGDLSILIRDISGALVDPFSITYSIFQKDAAGNPATLVSQPNVVPTRSSMGAYYAAITVPTTWSGDFQLIWYVVQFSASPTDQVLLDFSVDSINPTTSSFEAPSTLIAPRPKMKNKYAPAIMYVRELLSDTDPDKNYHFRPPTPGKVVAGYTSRVGFIWTDTTILRMLDISIAKLNVWNPMNLTNYTLDTVPTDWGKIASLSAASLCLSGEAARWAADEFSYSLNGVSLDINKAALYQSLGQTYGQEFSEIAPLATANRPYSAGLRQQRWLLG